MGDRLGIPGAVSFFIYLDKQQKALLLLHGDVTVNWNFFLILELYSVNVRANLFCPTYEAILSEYSKRTALKLFKFPGTKFTQALMEVTIDIYKGLFSTLGFRLRPYHPQHARSRLISEAKQGRAWSVLGWETAWEYQVL